MQSLKLSRQPSNIVRERSTLYFRQIIPKDLRHCWGKSSIKLSLKTGNVVKAKRKAAVMSAMIWDIFTALRKGDGRMTGLSTEELRALANSWLKEILEADEIDRMRGLTAEQRLFWRQEKDDSGNTVDLGYSQTVIEEIDKACEIGYLMHTEARRSCKPGVCEQEIVGRMEGVTISRGWGVSFATILSQHGETLHNHRHDGIITPGKLLLVDAGAESNTHYASDFTRTVPCGGKFSPVQRDIYDIVVACNDLAYDMAAPGVSYRDVHLAVAARMLEGLKALDLVRGDVQDMVTEGIAGMFMPHGLGHNMGIDVHDMEDLGEDLVGYDPGQRRSSQLGLGSLRMARVLKPGHVVTDEPGIYFIPALIAKWKAEGTGKDFINYGKLEKGYLDFGGIRLEDDLLITPDGCRRLGSRRLPIYPDEVEAAMAAE